METEIEVKILEINVPEIINKLNKINATKIKEKFQKRYTYDFNPIKENSWIRLRTDETTTTLTIKEIHNDNINGTKELEIIVNNFEKTNQFLNKLGYTKKNYQENKRISYKLNNVEIEIDFWPQIPPYLEIEAKTIKEIEKTVKLLGFKMSQTTSINTKKVYQKYNININSIKELKLE